MITIDNVTIMIYIMVIIAIINKKQKESQIIYFSAGVYSLILVVILDIYVLIPASLLFMLSAFFNVVSEDGTKL